MISNGQTASSLSDPLCEHRPNPAQIRRATLARLPQQGALADRGPIESTAQQAVVVGATEAMAGGVTTAQVAMLEATHRVITAANTVRAFTLLDVYADAPE